MSQSPRIGGFCRTASLLALLCNASHGALGQTPGVTANAVLIGSCSVLEGPSHALGTAQIKGAEAYFDLINEEGGDPRRTRGPVHGLGDGEVSIPLTVASGLC
jgi:hypothetical protein